MFIIDLLPRSLKVFIYEHRYFLKEKNHKDFLNKIPVNSFSIDNKTNWVNKFNKAIYSNHKIIEIAEEFFKSEIKVIKDRNVLSTDILAICVEKNDLIKLKKFISHHRKLGVDKFIILDNNSDDGTVEYLLKQKDVILLQIKTPYLSLKRIAWINRIIAHYGYDRWYLVADSDELLDYSNSDNKNIKDLIKYFEDNKVIRARALLLDMYAKPEYYTSKDKNYYNECIYFDTNSYYNKKDYRFYNISGGCRKRVFNISPCLTKYPLVYFRKKDIYINSHFLYPFKENFISECNLILKHYKFMPNDKEKMKKIVIDGNYYNNSIQYKHYMNFIEKNDKLNFFYEGTNKYNNSDSFNKIELYKKIDWK